MTQHSLIHNNLEWTKQKLGEIDLTLAALENTAGTFTSEVRKKADTAVAKFRTAGNAFKTKVEAALADAGKIKTAADQSSAMLDEEWVKVEAAFQAFLAAVDGQANAVTAALAARAEAQRKSLQTSLVGMLNAASETIAQAQRDANAAIRRLGIEAKLDQASTAGHESWKAIKSGVEETLSVYERTRKAISDTLTKLH